MRFKIKESFFFQLKTAPLPQWNPIFLIVFNIKKHLFSIQASLLWYFTQTHCKKLNVNLFFSSKTDLGPLEGHFDASYWWTLSAYVTYTSLETPLGTSAVRLCGRSVTWNGSISVHITEHIPYKAAASVYSLPPVRCWHPVAALYLRQCGGCVVFSHVSPAMRGD